MSSTQPAPSSAAGQKRQRKNTDPSMDQAEQLSSEQLLTMFKELREENRDLKRENREMQQQLRELVTQLTQFQSLLLTGKINSPFGAAVQQQQQEEVVTFPVGPPPPVPPRPSQQQAWTTVSHKGKQTYAQRAASAAPQQTKAAKTANNTPPVIVKSDRRILIPRIPKDAKKANPLSVRDTVNATLARCKAPARVVVTSAAYNTAGTLILTTCEDCPCADVLKQEIETMNPSVKLITTPRWLTKPEQRKNKGFSSIVIAVQSHNEAESILKKSLWLFNRKLKTARYLAVKPTDQCGRCQGFGHHATRCNIAVRCQICAAGHETRIHTCNTCNKRGKVCSHVDLKCANCDKAHKANDPSCEVIKQLRNPSKDGDASASQMDTDL